MIRSVLVCTFIMVVTPAPADAWFEWLDRLSGPGRWYGLKVDVRALCFGKAMPLKKTRTDLQALSNRLKAVSLSNVSAVQDMTTELSGIADQLRTMDAGLDVLRGIDLEQPVTSIKSVTRREGVLSGAEVDGALQPLFIALARVETVSVAIGTGGIFISLCDGEKQRSLALELGWTGLRTGGDERYARNRPIYMTTVTAGLSYRLPLPASRDVVDLGTNMGTYRFYSKGFDDFSGFTIEPFVDLHLPTAYALSDNKAERVLSRFTVRTGLAFFPGGFKAEQFRSARGIGDISGREASASVTVFFRVRG
jgi:hypothetical protein